MIELFSFLETFKWHIQLLLVMVTTLILSVVVSRLGEKIHRSLKRSQSTIDVAFILAIKKPLRLFIWVIGITFAIEIIDKYQSIDIPLLSVVYPFIVFDSP